MGDCRGQRHRGRPPLEMKHLCCHWSNNNVETWILLVVGGKLALDKKECKADSSHKNKTGTSLASMLGHEDSETQATAKLNGSLRVILETQMRHTNSPPPRKLQKTICTGLQF